jgi:hypothetical protein
MTNFLENFKQYEPKTKNRFIINVVGTDIPYHLFRSYKMYNQGKTIVVETEFYESTDWTFNPQEYFDIEDLLIQHLNPIGDVIVTLDFKVEEIYYEQSGDYGDDGLLVNKLKFVTSNCETIHSENLHNKTKTENDEMHQGD